MTKVLLVDDNPKYLKDALPYYGYEVHTASDGVQALDMLSKNDYNIILLDVMMPNMNGWDTLKAIRKRSQSLPVIMLTAVSSEQKMVAGLKTGADDYIIKPFILPNLLARMEAVLRRSTLHSGQAGSEFGKQPVRTLTEREKEILSYASKGDSNKDIAQKLFVKEVTVKTHLNSIFKKLKVKNRTQAVLAGHGHNIL
jgi:DNA-binding NarL/FixJ family response regulator